MQKVVKFGFIDTCILIHIYLNYTYSEDQLSFSLRQTNYAYFSCMLLHVFYAYSSRTCMLLYVFFTYVITRILYVCYYVFFTHMYVITRTLHVHVCYYAYSYVCYYANSLRMLLRVFFTPRVFFMYAITRILHVQYVITRILRVCNYAYSSRM